MGRGVYYCKKCKHKHIEGSNIGKKHKKFKFEGRMYFCSKCGHEHRITSNIGKEHFEFFEEAEEEETRKEVEQTTLSQKIKKEAVTRGVVPKRLPDFKEIGEKAREHYYRLSLIKSTVFDINSTGRLKLKPTVKQQVSKIVDLPPSILSQERELIQKAKERQRRLFARELTTKEGEIFYELEMNGYDLILYKLRREQ